MKVRLVGKNIELTDAIKDHLNHKINKNFQNLDPTTSLCVSLCVEKHRHIAHVTFKTNGATLRASDETKDLYTSVDSVLKKLVKNLKKRKARTKNTKFKLAIEQDL